MVEIVQEVHSLLRLCDFSFSGELAKMEFRGNGKKMDLDSYVVYVFGTFWVKFIDLILNNWGISNNLPDY